MKLEEIAAKLTLKTALILIGVVLLIGFTIGAVRSCDRSGTKAAQSRVDSAQSGAASNSAADAINTTTGVGGNAVASEELTRQNEGNIRNAPGANAPVNPAARDAGLRGLCKRAAYRDDAKCRVFKPNP